MHCEHRRAPLHRLFGSVQLSRATRDKQRIARSGDASWLVRIGAMRRLTLAVAAALLAFFVESGSVSWQARVIAGWDAGALVYLTLAWTLAGRSDAAMTRDHALTQDLGRYLIFLFIVSASFASIVTLGFVVGPIRSLPFWSRAWHLVLAVGALASSWLLIHTVFAFHYAHRYYGDAERHDSLQQPLLFPGRHDPDYGDFLYYSFVVGMTSQVADVAIASQPLRRLTMLHGILAFVFNIAVLALSINIFASVL